MSVIPKDWCPPGSPTTDQEQPRERRPFRVVALALAAEILLVAALFAVYQLGRYFGDGQAIQAMRHAAWLWDLERGLHLPDEAALQRWTLDWGPAARLANLYYVGLHFPGTGAAMLWMWFHDRVGYRRMRTELAILTGAGLVLHVLFPLAPPRLMPDLGMIDTMLTTGPSAYPDTTDGMANQFAAMPSLHVGWALLVALTVIRATTGRWRWLAFAHPIATFTVVVVTANHYWLDGVIAAILVAATSALVAGFRGGTEPDLLGMPAGQRALVIR